MKITNELISFWQADPVDTNYIPNIVTENFYKYAFWPYISDEEKTQKDNSFFSTIIAVKLTKITNDE